MIPHVLHTVWLSGDVPDCYTRLVDRFRRLNPTFTVKLWTRDNLPPMSNRSVFDAIPDADVAWKSDVLRYEILLQHGGVYADMDIFWHRGIADILEGNQYVCVFESGYHSRPVINNAFICARPWHPIAAALVSDLHASFEVHKSLHDAVGVRYMTRVLTGMGAVSYRHDALLLPKSMLHWMHGVDSDPDPDTVVRREGSIGTHYYAHRRGPGYAERLLDAAERQGV